MSIFIQGYSRNFTPKNIGKDCKFLPKFAKVSKNCRQNCQVTESMSLDSKILKLLTGVVFLKCASLKNDKFNF